MKSNDVIMALLCLLHVTTAASNCVLCLYTLVVTFAAFMTRKPPVLPIPLQCTGTRARANCVKT